MKTGKKGQLTKGGAIRYNAGRMILGTTKTELLEIDFEKREVRMLCHTHFTPNEIKTSPLARAAVERQRDLACHYLTMEGFLEGTKPCASDAEWCVRAGVIHDLTNDQDRGNCLSPS